MKKKKIENFVRRTISVPRTLDEKATKEITKQKKNRNVNYSSFVVELMANQLVK